MKGQDYIGFRTADGIFLHNSPKSAKVIGPKCSSTLCIKSRNCQKFDESTRNNIFNTFWKLNWEAKKVFVKSHVSQTPSKLNRVKNSRKQYSFMYKLPHKDGSLQVCRSMFLSTLSIKKDMVKGWIKSNIEAGGNKLAENQQSTVGKKSNAENQKSTSGNKSPSQDQRPSLGSKNNSYKVYLNEYFEQLEKMESHYCRKGTSKIYISAAFNSKADVYRDYLNYCTKKQVSSVSIFTFSTFFEQQNNSIFAPRKDQCDTCTSFKAKQISEEKYNTHILSKQRAQNEKNLDKIAAIGGRCHVFTMDVQAVKLCPNLNASAIYYKQRLQVHNFTIYNLSTHQCTNYWWNETNGDLSASTFASIIIHHLKTHCSTDKLPIIIYSDGCGYQNRNHILSNALSIFAIENDKVIEQKYLEKGHTQMECDSAHAKIEKKLKNKSIYLPIDYINVTKESRKTVKIDDSVINKPFDAMYLNYDFFNNYNEPRLIRFSSIRPGRNKNDPTVAQLRSLKYLPSGGVKFKVNFNDEYNDLPIRIKEYTGNTEPTPLHNDQLPIQPCKWKHLQDLKPVIPSEYHYFYDNLPQSNSKK